MKQIPKEVLDAFTMYESPLANSDAGAIAVEPISGGLINYSFKVSSPVKPDYLLQQINKKVFANPEHVQENYINIWKYAELEFPGLRLPSPRYCGVMTTLIVDENENYWRAFEFIEESKMVPVAQTPEQAKATAATFAKFTATFDDFNIQQLKKVIPGFHDLSLRYHQFEEAINGQSYERIARALSLIDELKKRERYKHFYEIIIESKEFPKRVMHHDAKIANVLFDCRTGEVVCPVDFDTVMPGYFFSDLGDMIRSMVCSEDETCTDFERITIRSEFYEAIVSGYLEIMGEKLTTAEKKYIHYSGPLMIYMQALRFITDYLSGDIYYRINHPEQNLLRAKNQLVLLQKLEQFLSQSYNFSNE